MILDMREKCKDTDDGMYDSSLLQTHADAEVSRFSELPEAPSGEYEIGTASASSRATTSTEAQRRIPSVPEHTVPKKHAKFAPSPLTSAVSSSPKPSHGYYGQRQRKVKI